MLEFDSSNRLTKTNARDAMSLSDTIRIVQQTGI